MNIQFIKAGIEYVNEIHSLVTEFYNIAHSRQESEKLKGSLAELLTHPKYGAVFLIKHSNEIAGYIILTFGYSLRYGGRDAYIDELFLPKAFRNKGIGGSAVDFIINYAKTIGIKVLHTEVKENNNDAEKVYEKKGFKVHDSMFMSLNFSGSDKRFIAS